MARVPNPAILALGGREALQPHGIAATVSRAPANTADTLDVEWPSADEVGAETDCKWTRRGTALPVVGDDALLLLDSRGDPWAVIW